jgi:D-lactate dehydrogenase (cytochrome)
VDALTIVLADGSPLTVRRGGIRARDGVLHVPAGDRSIPVPVPAYRMPDVVKVSAGYYAAPGMDLVDLFIGSEGTLGVITTITFRTLSPVPVTALAFVPARSEAGAMALVAGLRQEPAVAAIEHMDARCLEILREDGADRRNDVTWPAGTALALLVQIELPSGTTEASARDAIEGSDSRDTPLGRVCRVLEAHGVFDDTEMALPGQARRAEQLIAVREAVPAGVNQRVGRAQHAIDPRIAKTAADMIVPFERFGEMLAVYREGFASRRSGVTSPTAMCTRTSCRVRTPTSSAARRRSSFSAARPPDSAAVRSPSTVWAAIP